MIGKQDVVAATVSAALAGLGFRVRPPVDRRPAWEHAEAGVVCVCVSASTFRLERTADGQRRHVASAKRKPEAVASDLADKLPEAFFALKDPA